MYSRPLQRAYPSDLTDAQWALLEPLIPALSPNASYHLHERREIVNGILYVLRSGCPWRTLPHDLPPWGTVYHYFRRGLREGVWDHILQTLRMQVRVKEGRDAQPSAGVIDRRVFQDECRSWTRKGLRCGEKNMGTQAARTR